MVGREGVIMKKKIGSLYRESKKNIKEKKISFFVRANSSDTSNKGQHFISLLSPFLPLFLSLSLSHTHTNTHTHTNKLIIKQHIKNELITIQWELRNVKCPRVLYICD
jgi:hypothetical protein